MPSQANVQNIPFRLWFLSIIFSLLILQYVVLFSNENALFPMGRKQERFFPIWVLFNHGSSPSLTSLLNGFLSKTSCVARSMQDKMRPDTEKFNVLVVLFTGPKLWRDVDSALWCSQMCGRPTFGFLCHLVLYFRENIIPVRVKRRKELGRDYQRINYTLVWLFLHVFTLRVCDYTRVCHGTCVQVRGQIAGASFLLLSCGIQGSNSGHHTLKCL